MADQKVIVFVFTADLQQVVLIKERLKPEGSAKLNFVKGTHEGKRDTDLESTARRELREEIGVQEEHVQRLEPLVIEEGLYPQPPPQRYQFFQVLLCAGWDPAKHLSKPMADELIDEIVVIPVTSLSATLTSAFHKPVLLEVFLKQVSIN